MQMEVNTMDSAIHIKTKVLPGKRIQVSAGNLVEGESVDVFVVVPPRPSRRRRSVRQLLRSKPAPGVFTSSDEVDTHIRKERDSWER